MGKNQSGEKFKSKIGGQALIEGIMMLGPNKGAMACRLPDGTIDLETWDENNGKNAPWYRKVPLVRGCFNFVTSLIKGYKYTMRSAEKQMTEDEEEAKNGKNEGKKDEKSSGGIFDLMMTVVSIMGVVLAVALFVFLPKLIIGFIPHIEDYGILRSVLEGIVKIAIFVGYMAIISLMKDIKRQYMYHGAEHKTIACHEAELPLTVKNVRRQTRFHKLHLHRAPCGHIRDVLRTEGTCLVGALADKPCGSSVRCRRILRVHKARRKSRQHLHKDTFSSRTCHAAHNYTRAR